MKQFLEAGRIVGTHGILGEVKMDIWCDDIDFLKQFDRLYIDELPYTVARIRPHKGMALIVFDGINAVEDAMKLRDKTVYFDREQATLAPGRIYITDMLGMEVYDRRTQQTVGRLVDVLFLPSGEVYVVKGDKGQFMIPSSGGFIEPVNPDDGKIFVNTILGMLPDEN